MEKKNVSPSEIALREHQAIVEFNQMLHSGKYSSEYCYKWLEEKKKEIKADVDPIMWPILDFNFLYPEVINLEKFLKEYDGKK